MTSTTKQNHAQRLFRLIPAVVLLCTFQAGAQVDGWLPEQIYLEKDGYCVWEVEENLDYNKSAWKLITGPSSRNFTGSGYLHPQGGTSREDMLIFRVYIANPGPYLGSARVYHKSKDGDNDAWYNKLGYSFERKRIVDYQQQSGCRWMNRGHRVFFLKRGLHAFYIAKRSSGFGIDRFVMFMKNVPFTSEKGESPKDGEDAQGPNVTPASEFVTDENYTIGPSTLNMHTIHAKEFAWKDAGYREWDKDKECIYLPSKSGGTVEKAFEGESGNYDVLLTFLLPNTDKVTDENARPGFNLFVKGEDKGRDVGFMSPGIEFDALKWENVAIEKGDMIKLVPHYGSRGGPQTCWRAVSFFNCDKPIKEAVFTEENFEIRKNVTPNQTALEQETGRYHRFMLNGRMIPVHSGALRTTDRIPGIEIIHGVDGSRYEHATPLLRTGEK
jgi:hypothetical protein